MKKNNFTGWSGVLRCSILSALLLAAVTPAQAVFSELYPFPVTPQQPNGSIVQGLDGNYYGTTVAGGLYGVGSIYKMTPGGTLTVIFSFATTNGANPNSTLLLQPDGNFYGTATAGGDNSAGLVFRITPAGVFSNLYTFDNDHGATPNAGLTPGAGGIMYGTTYAGGLNGPGTVYSITTNGVFTLLGSFDFTKGYNPNAPVIVGSDGNFYGTTTSGGDNGNGTVYVMGTTGQFTNLFSFDVDHNGSSPDGGLIETSPGVFYGTTTGGGTNGFGTLFAVNKNGAFTNLLTFGGTNGAAPHDKLVQAPDGTLYGTTFNGGSSDNGTIFKLTPGGSFSSIFSFNSANGANPFAELTLGTNGVLYGTTANGPVAGLGTVFQITTNGAFTLLTHFTSFTGASPRAALTDGHDGKYYGTTYVGGTNNYGLFFSVTPAGLLTPLYSFDLTNGANPTGTLLLASNGNFFGTASAGGSNSLGTIFEIAKSGVLVRAVSCDTNTGGAPQAGLAFGLDGYVYGTALQGGTFHAGTVFKMSPAGLLAGIFSFSNPNGRVPIGGLVRDANGDFYGTTAFGAAHFAGSVFKITTNGTYTILAVCDGSTASPQAAMTFIGTNLYGTSANGGDNAAGSIFVYTNGQLLNLASFDSAANGANPVAPLVAGTDGNLYGTTSGGGLNGGGTVFRMTPDGTITALASFSGFDGAGPVGGLLQATNGDLFGVNSAGSQGNGNIFKVLSLSSNDPPLISSQPQSQQVNAGQNVSFHVLAASLTTLGYQWYFGATPLNNSPHYGGTKLDTLVLTNTTLADLGSYSVVITNAAGSSTSLAATLSVIAHPLVTTNPVSVQTNYGATVNFQVSGTGGQLTYLWKRNGSALSDNSTVAGSSTDTLTLTGVQPTNAGTYSVVLNNSQGIATSTGAILSLFDPPTISINPLSVTNNVNETAVFRVTASSAIPVTYHWFKGGAGLSESAHIVGSTASALSIVGVTDPDVDSYGVVVSNASGGVTSSPATFSIIDVPSILSQPVGLATNAGGTVSFHVTDTGPSSVYRWKKGVTLLSNNSVFSGVTTANLTLTGVFAANDGSYFVQITNTAGSTQSVAAVLAVADPFVSGEPVDQAINKNSAATFHVTAIGTSLTYQWRSNNVPLSNNSKISGALTSTLTVGTVQPGDAASYSVTVSGPDGPVASSNAVLSVIDIPAIVSQSGSIATNAGATVNFHVVADGLQIVYQWQRNGVNLTDGGKISGSTNASLTLTGVLAADEGSYTVHITNSVASVDSTNAVLTVADPYIVTQPASRTNNEATTATFTVAALGTSLGYQWNSNGVALTDGGKISGALTPTLTVAAVVHVNQASYSVTVSGAKTPVTSSPAVLSVIDIPTVAISPVSVATNAGATVNFQAVGIGPNLGYQWRRNNSDLTDGAGISGSTTTNLTLSGVIAANAGTYLAHISNVAGSVDTGTATLSVTDPYIYVSPASQTVNAGTTGLFSVVAAGTTLTYQWRSNGVSLSNGGTVTGATSATLSIANLIRSNSASYSVQVTGFSGNTLTTTNAVLTVIDPAINLQPQDAGVNLGDTHVFSVSAGGTPNLQYQWYFASASTHVTGKMLGKTSTSITLSSIASNMIGNYFVIITNQLPVPNSVTSRLAKLFFNIPPKITVQPKTLTKVAVGAKVTLTVSASGTAPLGFQWSHNNTNLLGQVTNKLILTNAQTSDTGTYQCLITNASGLSVMTDTNHGVVLVTNIPPKITKQPANFTIIEGNNVTFSIAATGTAPLSYQWFKDAVLIPDATNKTCAVINARGPVTNLYSCTVSNPAALLATTLSTHGLLKVNADVKGPSISILYPTSGQRLTNFTDYTYGGITLTTPDFILVGSIIDNGLITSATIQQTYPVSGQPEPANLVLAAPGKARFTNQLELMDGTNTFVIYAYDSSGNASKPVTRSVFYVNHTTMLTVVTNGNGTLLPVNTDAAKTPFKYGEATNTAFLEVGRNYKIQAVSGANTIFTNWTDGNNSLLGTNVLLTFRMMPSLSIQANFVTNPIVAAHVNGSYNGLFYVTNETGAPVITEDSSGAVSTLTVKTNRTFSGKLLLNGVTTTFSGSFDLSGDAHVVANRDSKNLQPLGLTLHLDWVNDTKQITGTVTNIGEGPWVAPLVADLAIFSTNNPFAGKNRFTMVIPPSTNAPEAAPGGAGYAAITNSAAGKALFTGKLGDGTAIALSLPISKDGNVPYYQDLYLHQGLIIGWLAFPTDGDQPPQYPYGDLTWIKPGLLPAAATKNTTYLGGFTNTVSVIGSRFDGGTPVIGGVTTLDITDGDGLNLPLTYTVHLGVNNILTKVGPTPTNSLSGSINKTTGLMTVTFHSTDGPARTATGAAIQVNNAAYGWFLASTNSLGATNTGLIHLH